jgi:hypothetical protein
LIVCSFPERAQRPIVSAWKCTFAAASSSAASEREIQSAGGFDIAQLPSPAVELALGLGLASFVLAASPGAAGPLALPDDRDDAFSLRAQPLPLKWTAGAANDFRMGLPQAGQTEGPAPCRGWTTSTSCPQPVQT